MKSVLVHGVLAVGGLILAWTVWLESQASESSASQVTIWDCERSQLQSVHFEAEKREAKLERREQDGEPLWWITLTAPEEPRRGRRHAKKEAPSKDESTGEISTSQFRASDHIDDYLKEAAPLVAGRKLGEVDEGMLKKLELEDTKRRLTIACGGEKRAFDVGRKAYGSGDRYLRPQEGGPVYLVTSRLVDELRHADSRLKQRAFHRFDLREVKTIDVDVSGKKRTLLQRNRHEPREAEWVDAAKPDQRNELYGNWLSKVHRLRVQEYLQPRAKPGSDLQSSTPAPKTVVSLIYRGEDGNELGSFRLDRVDVDPPRYYARTKATRTWVTVRRELAEQVERDARPVVGLEARETASTSAQASAEDADAGTSGAPESTQAGAAREPPAKGADENAPAASPDGDAAEDG